MGDCILHNQISILTTSEAKWPIVDCIIEQFLLQVQRMINGSTIYLKSFFYQNDCFLENGGTSKIRLLQCYLVPTLDSCYCRNLKQIYKLKSLAPDIPKAQTS